MLTDQQKEALPHVKWLISPFRDVCGTGRTEVLAHAYIGLALENPALEIRVRDHSYEFKNLDTYMMERIDTVFRKDYRRITPLNLVINIARKTIALK